VPQTTYPGPGYMQCQVSGLPYFTTADDSSKAAVALTTIFLQPLLSSILQQQKLTWVERPTCSCSHSLAIEFMHVLFSFLAPTYIFINTFNFLLGNLYWLRNQIPWFG